MSTETRGEAKRFERHLAAYRRQGLCEKCSAQAAFGHADGWDRIHPPCGNCAELVANLPLETASSWRKLEDPYSPRSGAAKGGVVGQYRGVERSTSEWSTHAPTTRFWSPV